MAVRKVQRNGETRLLIDIRYKTRDGRRARLRKDAEVQTMTVARAEEKRYLINIALHGEPYGTPPIPSRSNDTQDASASNDVERKTFAVVVDEFRQTYMITELKVTTRRGYESVLHANLLPRFGELTIDKVDGKAASDLDLDLTKRKLTRATRNNSQIVLRSVLRFAKTRQYIDDAPTNLPRLKPVEQQVLEIPDDQQVDHILETANDAHRLTFALMSDAGLRPNEVRALRCKNVQLKWENGKWEMAKPLAGSSRYAKGNLMAKRTRPRLASAKSPFRVHWPNSSRRSLNTPHVTNTWRSVTGESPGVNGVLMPRSGASPNALVSKDGPSTACAITRLPRGCALAFRFTWSSAWLDT